MVAHLDPPCLVGDVQMGLALQVALVVRVQARPLPCLPVWLCPHVSLPSMEPPGISCPPSWGLCPLPLEWGGPAPARPWTQPSCWLHRWQGLPSLTLRLPDGFFPRTEAVMKLQSEPSGNRETSTSPPPRPLCCRQALGLRSLRGPCPFSEAGSGGVGSHRGSLMTGMTEGPDVKP